MGQYSNVQLTSFVDDLTRRLARAESQLAVLAEKAGVVFDDPAAGIPDEVVALVRSGDRLGATARYRALTGASLPDAKAAIERI